MQSFHELMSLSDLPEGVQILDSDVDSNSALYAMYSRNAHNPVCVAIVSFSRGASRVPVAVGIMAVDPDGVSSDTVLEMMAKYSSKVYDVSFMSNLTHRPLPIPSRYVEYKSISESHIQKILKTSTVVHYKQGDALVHQDVHLLTIPAALVGAPIDIVAMLRMSECYRVARQRLSMETMVSLDPYAISVEGIIKAIANGATVFPVKANGIAIIALLGQDYVRAVVSSDGRLNYTLAVVDYDTYLIVSRILNSYIN